MATAITTTQAQVVSYNGKVLKLRGGNTLYFVAALVHQGHITAPQANTISPANGALSLAYNWFNKGAGAVHGIRVTAIKNGNTIVALKLANGKAQPMAWLPKSQFGNGTFSVNMGHVLAGNFKPYITGTSLVAFNAAHATANTLLAGGTPNAPAMAPVSAAPVSAPANKANSQNGQAVRVAPVAPTAPATVPVTAT